MWTVQFSPLSTCLNVVWAAMWFFVPAILAGRVARAVGRRACNWVVGMSAALAVLMSAFFWSPGTWFMVYPHRPFYELLAASVALYPAMSARPGRWQGLRILMFVLVWVSSSLCAWDNVRWFGGLGRSAVLDVPAVANMIGIPVLAACALWMDRRAGARRADPDEEDLIAPLSLQRRLTTR